MVKFHTSRVSVYEDVIRGVLSKHPGAHSEEWKYGTKECGMLFLKFERNTCGTVAIGSAELGEIPFRVVVLSHELGADKVSTWLWGERIESVRIRVLSGSKDWEITLGEFYKRKELLEFFMEMLIKLTRPPVGDGAQVIPAAA